MRSFRVFALTAMAVAAGVFSVPSMAQQQPSSSVLTDFLTKQQVKSAQTQNVTAQRSAYDDANKIAQELNAQAANAMAQAASDGRKKSLAEMQSIYEAEKAKIANIDQIRMAHENLAPIPGSPGEYLMQQQQGAVPAQAQGKPPAQDNAIRVFTPKKDPAGDKPRRLFNVR